jgi:hypothetical protein
LAGTEPATQNGKGKQTGAATDSGTRIPQWSIHDFTAPRCARAIDQGTSGVEEGGAGENPARLLRENASTMNGE